VLDREPTYQVTHFARQVRDSRLRVLAETHRAFRDLLVGISRCLDCYGDRVVRAELAFDYVIWTPQSGKLVCQMTYSGEGPPADRRLRLDDFVDDTVPRPIGVQNAPLKGLVVGLVDQFAVAAVHHPVDLHRVAFRAVRSTRAGELVADIRLGRSPFIPREAAWT